MGVLTQEPRGSPHPGAERVSSPGYQEGVLTPKSIGCPHSSPRAERLDVAMRGTEGKGWGKGRWKDSLCCNMLLWW